MYVQKYCRFCAEIKMNEDLLDLQLFPFLNEAIKVKLSVLNVGFEIDMSCHDYLPKTVCSSCRDALVQAHEFVMRLRNSQCALRMIFSAKLEEKDEEELKEAENKEVYVGILDGKLLENECDTTDEGIKEELNDDTSIKSESGNECDTITVESPIEADYVTDNESIKSIIDTLNNMGVQLIKQDRPLNETLHTITNKQVPSVTDSVIDKEPIQPINNTFNNMGVQLIGQNGPLNETSDMSTTLDASWTTYKCNCPYCEESLPNINALREHCREDHDRLCCTYKCAYCKEGYKSFEKFADHATLHRDALRKYCPYCNISLELSTNKNHVDDHRNQDNICDHCGKIFDSKDHLEQHKRDNYYHWDILETDFGKPWKEIKDRSKSVSPSKLQNIEDETWNDYPWTCQICNHESGDLTLLRAHIKEVHGKCFAMKCVDCDVVMQCYRHFAHHVRKHRRFLMQYCHYCNYKFKEDEPEWDHISEHFAEEYRVCDGCGETLPDRRAYRKHVSTYEPPESSIKPHERFTKTTNFKCDICQRVLVNINAFRLHQNVHKQRKKEDPAQCEHCGEMFYKKFELKIHLTSKHKERSKICKICNRGFRTPALLRSHAKTHLESKYQCDICKQWFKTKYGMTVHLQGVHADQKKFQCPVCGKKFAFLQYLKSHELQHTGVKPHLCPDCGRLFTTWGNCNKHMKRIHGTTLATTFKPRRKPIDT